MNSLSVDFLDSLMIDYIREYVCLFFFFLLYHSSSFLSLFAFYGPHGVDVGILTSDPHGIGLRRKKLDALYILSTNSFELIDLTK